MSLKAGQVDKVISKLGMKVRNGKDRHAWLYHNGKPVLHTMRSHGRGDLGNIAHVIRQQLKVNEQQFADLISCPLKLEGYLQILKSRGVIT